ncbi:arylamine N-acetyltransferase [Gordonia sp. VNQ95]|uniref:arylamine N-acetyltransferase family protein n=1 Tax=Gordonia sp. VNQ95 TaxID=3156619 RepID=UPI0032B3B118
MDVTRPETTRAVFSLPAYLDRIGIDAPTSRGAELVAQVAAAQHARVPFENLDIHRGIPVESEESAIVARLVDGRRGGICYELNGLLAMALRALGLQARVIGARVDAGGQPGPPLGHMAVVVTVDGATLLVDVGFGGERVCRPVDLASERDRRVDVGSAAYVLESHPRPLADFEAMAWWHSTSPRSRFTRSLICTLPDGDGRRTLTDTDVPGRFRLIITNGEHRTESILDPAAARHVCLRDFGVDLAEMPLGVAQFATRPATE